MREFDRRVQRLREEERSAGVCEPTTHVRSPVACSEAEDLRLLRGELLVGQDPLLMQATKFRQAGDVAVGRSGALRSDSGGLAGAAPLHRVRAPAL